MSRCTTHDPSEHWLDQDEWRCFACDGAFNPKWIPGTGLPVINYENMELFLKATQKVSYKEFCQVLWDTIGAREDYAAGVWQRYVSSPMYYIYSRNPDTQGKGLFDVIMKHYKELQDAGK